MSNQSAGVLAAAGEDIARACAACVASGGGVHYEQPVSRCAGGGRCGQVFIARACVACVASASAWE